MHDVIIPQSTVLNSHENDIGNPVMRKILQTILISTCLAITPCVHAAESLYTDQPSVMPKLAKGGKWSVGVSTINITNPDQLSSADFVSRVDRPLVLEVWYPASLNAHDQTTTYKNTTRSGKTFELVASAYRDAQAIDETAFPLIVLSHGYTGYRTIMYYLGEHLASHGYVVAAIDHTDSTNSEIDFTKNAGAGFMSTLLNRARDQQFVLDYFTSEKSSLAGITDTDTAAVIGYSMGGYGAINTVGGCYEFKAATLQTLGVPAQQANALAPIFSSCSAGRKSVDPRWQAMIAIAPWGGELDVHQAQALANISTPSLFVAGDDDDISGFENGVKKIFEQTNSPKLVKRKTDDKESKKKNKFLLVYENARHNIAAHPAPKVAYTNDLDIGHYFEPSWNSETLNRINQHMSLAFLNCYLKSDASSCRMLPNSEDITQRKDRDGKLSAPWPGFPERWGTGVKFHRR